MFVVAKDYSFWKVKQLLVHLWTGLGQHLCSLFCLVYSSKIVIVSDHHLDPRRQVPQLPESAISNHWVEKVKSFDGVAAWRSAHQKAMNWHQLIQDALLLLVMIISIHTVYPALICYSYPLSAMMVQQSSRLRRISSFLNSDLLFIFSNFTLDFQFEKDLLDGLVHLYLL